jgi:hypothetical protein
MLLIGLKVILKMQEIKARSRTNAYEYFWSQKPKPH